MKKENIKGATQFIQVALQSAEDRIAQNGGILYIVDSKHRYLWYGNWLWNLHDKKEVRDLIEDCELCHKPRWVPKAWLIDAFRDGLGSQMQTRELTAPITRRSGSTINEYRADLQQYILSTYYPTNTGDGHDK